MTLVGLDLNATRARAVAGPAGAPPHPLPLAGSERELPSLVNMSNRQLEAGKSASALCRKLPHLVCANFLPKLGTAENWSAGRHRLDSARALTTLLESMRGACATAKSMVVAIPDYLSRQQADLLPALGGKARLPLVGSISAALASALSAYRSAPWSGLALVVDVDDYALCCSLLASDRREIGYANDDREETDEAPGALVIQTPAAETPSLSRTHVVGVPNLGVRIWKGRLIDAVSDRCVRHSRRDPRDSAVAEQLMYEQLEEVLDASWQEQSVEIVVQGEHWCQNQVLRPEEIRAIVVPLVDQARDAVHEILAVASSQGVRCALMTTSAARLPGLSEAVQEEVGPNATVIPLAADSAALGAHEVAGCFLRGERRPQHLEAIVNSAAEFREAQVPQRRRRLFGF